MVDAMRWAPRLSKDRLRRLYQSDAAGMLDEALLDDVGTTLYQRCRSILDVRDAKAARVHCPTCAEKGVETIILRGQIRRDEWNETKLVCPVCGWQVTWGDFVRSTKRRQLNSGGALVDFEWFVNVYPRLRLAGEKMLAIDRLIHAFHYSISTRPEMPSRPVGPNLINGKLEDVIEFLNELTAGEPNTAGLDENRRAWQATLERYQKEFLQDYVVRGPGKE